MSPQFIVIGRWDDPSSRKLTLQDFVIDGRSYIAVFSDEGTFKRQMAGTPFEREGIAIDRDLLLSILGEHDLVILDPATPRERKMTKVQLAAVLGGDKPWSSDA